MFFWSWTTHFGFLLYISFGIYSDSFERLQLNPLNFYCKRKTFVTFDFVTILAIH